MRGGGRVKRRRRSSGSRVGLRLVLGATLLLGGCAHRTLERMVEQGEFEAAAKRGAMAKRPLRRRAAWAYAKALAELDRVEEARTVLLRDFRTSGDVTPLVKLADLEAERGIFGMATVHYSRAVTLDGDVLRGREDVCELLRRRAAVFVADGEALAADQDVRRVMLLCPHNPGSAQGLADEALAAKIRVEAQAAARDLRTLKGCADGSCVAGRGERAGEIELALASARKEGPRALRAVARERQIEVRAEDVIMLLSGELRGELGVALVTNDELRAWIGEAPIEALAAATAGLPTAEKAYVRLRMGRMGPGYTLPVGEKEPGSEAALVTQALDALDEQGPIQAALGWRVLALIGDLPGAEMTLVSSLRTEAAERSKVAGSLGGEASAADDGPPTGDAVAQVGTAPTEKIKGPAQTRIPEPSYAAGRIPVGPDTWKLMLVLAHMREASGNHDQALEISRYVLAEAHALGFAEVETIAGVEAHAALASGRPWQAMALADAVGGIDAFETVAAAAILLQRAACADGCGEGDDRAAVERVVGEAWVLERGAKIPSLASRRSFLGEARGESCPQLAALLAEDSVGVVASGFRSGRSASTLTAERALREAIEADISLVCAGRLAAPVMIHRRYTTGAAILMQHLSQAPQMIAAGGLATHAEIALAAEKEEQARSFFDAAAASSPAPAVIWERALRAGQLAQAREVELVALRRLLLLPLSQSRASELHRALVVRAARDANDAWATRENETGAEALAGAVRDYIDRYTSSERWWAREKLAQALARESWRDDTAAALIRRSLWPDAELAQLHPAANRRLEAALQRQPAAGVVDPLSPEEVATALDPTSADLGAMAEVFGARALAGVRLARARLELDTEGRRMAVAVAVSGDPKTRAQALHVLLAGLSAQGEDDARLAVEGLLLGGLPAIAAGEAEPVSILSQPEMLVDLLFEIGPYARAQEPRRD